MVSVSWSSITHSAHGLISSLIYRRKWLTTVEVVRQYGNSLEVLIVLERTSVTFHVLGTSVFMVWQRGRNLENTISHRRSYFDSPDQPSATIGVGYLQPGKSEPYRDAMDERRR